MTRAVEGVAARRLRLALLLVTVLGCVACDQATKAVVRGSLAPGQVVSLGHGAVRLMYAENPGAFLSLGADLPPWARTWLFTVGVGGALFGLLALLLRDAAVPVGTSLGIALMTGGGVGNLIDRVCHDGRVVDFLEMGVGGLRTGIFNVADAVITLGAVVLVVDSWRRR